MRPEIERYLEEHGDTYTSEALRRGLLDAGYDPVEVDGALREWVMRAQQPAAADDERRRFWWWAIGLHAAVLVGFSIIALAIGSFAGGGWAILVILAVVLLVGVGISGAVGRSVLRGSGLTIALLVPAISALLIAGSCLAVGGSFLLQEPPPAPRTGVMELRIDPPLSFEGSGSATCQTHRGSTGYSIFSENLGMIDGKVVTVSVEAFDLQEAPGAPAAAPGAEVATSVFISLNPQSGVDEPVYYTNAPPSRVELDASSDGLSATGQFEALEGAMGEGPPGETPGLEPISGTISWDCE